MTGDGGSRRKGRLPSAAHGERDPDPRPSSRREFLRKAGTLSAGVAAAPYLAERAAVAADPAGRAIEAPVVACAESSMPTIRLGGHSISRLICGANPFNAGSHLSVFVNQELRRYYTTEQVLKTLRRCQEVGINCWQSSGDDHERYRRFVDEGGKMHYISLEKREREMSGRIRTLKEAGSIALAHHGEVTDQLFKRGKLDEVGDFLKQVKDSGLVAGVSTHMPAVVDAVESKGWEVDFYMTCVYERHRSADELMKLLGHVPIPVGEVYLTEDPPRMFRAIQQTKRPCLAFKILAAGRLSERADWVEKAFRETYESIKPTDAVIIGIYDRYTDQVAEDAAFARRFSGLSRPA